MQITEHCPSRCRIYHCDRCKGIAAVPPLASSSQSLGAVITSDMGWCKCLYLHEGVHTISSEEVWAGSCCYLPMYVLLTYLQRACTRRHAYKHLDSGNEDSSPGRCYPNSREA